jgi:hypothetical protein
MKECAFCPETAKLSLEHLWSAWMDELFPGRKRFTDLDEEGRVIRERYTKELDATAKVVCENCNNGWMSNLESQHAKPAMMELITGKVDIPISKSRARSIALFAFKTAVVFDHCNRSDPPFFQRSSRHLFAKSLVIPFGVSMWMTGFLPIGKGAALVRRHEGQLSATKSLKLYVCTYSVGHLVFQVVACRQQTGMFIPFSPQRSYENLAIPFFPHLPRGISWPPDDVLRTDSEFEEFASRWQVIVITRPRNTPTRPA